MMKRYLVKIKSTECRDELVRRFEKVGAAEAIPDYLIVKTDQPIEAIRACPGVEAVELDEQATPSAVNQVAPPGWALPWLSNSGGSYKNDKTGAGVDIYIMDTGIRDTHVDLADRVRTLWSFDDAPYSLAGGQSPTHGTSVAGCAAGTAYGTAKEASIVNIRIDFMTSTILKGLDRILRDHLDKLDDRPSVLNFSGGSISPMIGDIFARLVQYGIVVVAAAGNESAPISSYPASNDWVVSVGSLNEQEKPSWFTNKQANIYAPGQNILTASVFSDTSAQITSGTSFSCPYYAGLLACLLEGSDKFNTGALVETFNFAMRRQIADQNRVPFFDNGGYTINTANTKGLGGVYYVSPSKQYTDAEIEEFLRVNEANPQLIAAAALSGNVSLRRLSRASAYTADQINEYFASAGVKTWWTP